MMTSRKRKKTKAVEAPDPANARKAKAITRRLRNKTAEEALQESLQILEGIINSIPVRVFWKDKNLCYLGCNAAFARDAGFTDPKDMIGKDDYQMTWRDQAELYRGDDHKVIESGRPKLNIEEPQTTPEGNTITLLTNKIPLRDGDGEISGVLGTYMDITDRKQVEQKLLKTNHDLEAATIRANEMAVQAEMANVAKSQFLANMSHEIRTPLTAVLGFAALLKSTPLTRVQKDYVSTICHSGDLLISLINNILDFSKIEAGQLALEQINFNLEYLITTLLEIVRELLAGKPIALEVVYPDAVPRIFNGDPTRLRQVLLNLLNNAVKFTDRGTITLTVGYAPALDGAGQNMQRVTLSVRDTGIGIPAHKQRMVFETFVQGDGSTTRKYGGSGLGLAICKQLVEKMGGSISLVSEVGKGSDFTVALPLAPGQSACDEHIQILTPEELVGRGALIVEDKPSNQSLLIKYCQDAGLRLAGVMDSAPQALSWLENNAASIDLVLCGILTPLLEGQTFAENVRCHPAWRHIKLVALSSEAMPGDAELSHRRGFDAYLSKPFSQKELYQILQATLGDARELKDTIITRHVVGEMAAKNAGQPRVEAPAKIDPIREDTAANI